MKRIQFLFALTLLSVLSTSTVWASDDEPNQCKRLHVQIGNATKSICNLVNSKVNHGTLMMSPPAVIMSGFTERFDIAQTFYGPDITLTYNCGGRTISFNSQQNVCVLKAGQVTGTVLEANGIAGQVHVENGSYAWSQPGNISWVLM